MPQGEREDNAEHDEAMGEEADHRCTWKRLVFEDLGHSDDYLRVVAQHSQSFLCTALENLLRAGRAHPINNVGRRAS
jgi:hypothetical protein